MVLSFCHTLLTYTVIQLMLNYHGLRSIVYGGGVMNLLEHSQWVTGGCFRRLRAVHVRTSQSHWYAVNLPKRLPISASRICQLCLCPCKKVSTKSFPVLRQTMNTSVLCRLPVISLNIPKGVLSTDSVTGKSEGKPLKPFHWQALTVVPVILIIQLFFFKIGLPHPSTTAYLMFLPILKVFRNRKRLGSH